ncbi:MAG: hypothetical protein JST16_07750 [Bdellovibrionales bacterium]|nr:hypothetical protein [Bdellovibrionales bacterium]
MKKSRYSEDKMIAAIKQVEAGRKVGAMGISGLLQTQSLFPLQSHPV